MQGKRFAERLFKAWRTSSASEIRRDAREWYRDFKMNMASPWLHAKEA